MTKDELIKEIDRISKDDSITEKGDEIEVLLENSDAMTEYAKGYVAASNGHFNESGLSFSDREYHEELMRMLGYLLK